MKGSKESKVVLRKLRKLIISRKKKERKRE